MKEDDFLKIIKTLVGKKYIGDDCAYIKALGIVITQDSLVEDVHFSMKYMTPYQLGYKSGKVNISDIIASGGIPKYISVALSLPKTTTNEFVEEFYQGLINSIDKVEIIGGDITGSDKIMICGEKNILKKKYKRRLRCCYRWRIRFKCRRVKTVTNK